MIHLNERSAANFVADPSTQPWRCDLVALSGAIPQLTVIVPVYNEAATIAELLRRVLEVPIEKHVIVVDDASTDGTAEVLDDWQGHPEVDLIRHATTRGKGAAIRTALASARGKFTIIQDADLEYDPRDYQAVIDPLARGEADVVYGSRYPRRERIERANRLFRWGVGALNLAVCGLYGVRLSDEATCYKAFPTLLLRALDLECERFEFCPEVTAKVCRMGLTIKEVQISYHPRSTRDGKKLRFRDGIDALRALWKWRNWHPPDGPDAGSSRNFPGRVSWVKRLTAGRRGGNR
jgi:glycosyltransferase involved in cell wall biosynthesis